jgi:hypothetical protein
MLHSLIASDTALVAARGEFAENISCDEEAARHQRPVTATTRSRGGNDKLV